jgi:hypothetical protein
MNVSTYLCMYLCTTVYFFLVYVCMYVCMYVFVYVYMGMYMYLFVVSADLKLSTSDQASSQSDRSQSIPLPEKDHRFLQEGGGRYPVV